MKILIADQFEAQGIAALKAAECNIVQAVGLKDDGLVKAIADAHCDILIVRSTKVTAAMMDAGPRLALIIRAGAGFNTIDVAAASQRSILVANCPGKNAVAVAELTFGLILALDRRIADATADLRAGKWNKKLYSAAEGLKGRTLAIIGMGQIGQEVAVRAHAFDMPVVAWSRSLTPETANALGVTCASTIEDAAAACDILSVHLAYSKETDKRIGASVFERLKPGSMVINTARGEVMDYAALAGALESRQLRVGLDVFEAEPKEGVAAFSDRLLAAGGIVYGTPHIGASTAQAQNAIADETVRIVTTYLRTGRVENCVNLCARSPARYVLLVRHLNRPGVLAHTLNAISHAGVNVEEMENVICDGAMAACARIKLDVKLDEAVVEKIRTGHAHIISVIQSPLRDLSRSS